VLSLTKDEFILYDNYIPILPYFSCSVGFTFSAKQKFGWTDTPYLKNSLDLKKCKTFS
jgi:peptidoglycan hydrolase-like amidase